MNFLEKDLEQIIFEADKSKLYDRGLFVFGKLKRQLRLGNYGIADLVSFSRPYYFNGEFSKGIITIFELKKNNEDNSTLLQSARYYKAICRYLYEKGILDNYLIRIVLIGSYVDTQGDFIFLCSMINNLELYQYSYDFDGITFTKINATSYKLSVENFNSKM